MYFMDVFMNDLELLQLNENVKQGHSEYQSPVAIELPKNAIYQFAEQISKKYRESINATNNINLYDFVEYLKGFVHCFNLSDYLNISGSIFVHEKNSFDIVLPIFTSPIRDRFTIAHEIGHYFLHSLAGERKICANREGSNLVEWEANWFAASFLMPKYLIEEKNYSNENIIAEAFGVSKDAAKYRLQTFHKMKF